MTLFDELLALEYGKLCPGLSYLALSSPLDCP
jgi:hypothetical protein